MSECPRTRGRPPRGKGPGLRSSQDGHDKKVNRAIKDGRSRKKKRTDVPREEKGKPAIWVRADRAGGKEGEERRKCGPPISPNRKNVWLRKKDCEVSTLERVGKKKEASRLKGGGIMDAANGKRLVRRKKGKESGTPSCPFKQTSHLVRENRKKRKSLKKAIIMGTGEELGPEEARSCGGERGGAEAMVLRYKDILGGNKASRTVAAARRKTGCGLTRTRRKARVHRELPRGWGNSVLHHAGRMTAPA